jgi:EpsI family protein
MSWTQYVPATVLAAGAAVTWWIGTPQPTPLAHPLPTTIPAQFMGAPGKDITLSADEVRGSGVTDYVTREFDLGGFGPAALYVGYHATQQGDKRMHSPTLCLPGSGWTPVASKVVTVPVGAEQISVNRFVLQKDKQRILVYYWFQGRGRITTGEAELKMNAFKDALLSQRDEEALVRIVVPIGKGDWADPIGRTGLPADSVAVQLASVAIPAVTKALPPAP